MSQRERKSTGKGEQDPVKQNTRLCEEILVLQHGLNRPGSVHYLILVAFAFMFCRPQDTVQVIGSIKIFTFIQVLLASYWLWHARRTPLVKPVILMLAFLVYGTAWIPLARNNFWAFHTVRDLAITFFGFVFPMMIFMGSGRRMRWILGLWAVIGAYLGVFGMTHSGFGPGGFLLDENDLCLTLDMFMAFSLIAMFTAKTRKEKFFYAATTALILGGIVSTMSRGGFVGLVALVGYLVAISRRKLIAVAIFVLLAPVVLFFIPESYWMEMSTISTQESTAQDRFHIWGIVMDMWLNLEHFFFGVGMQNTQWWVGDYEPASAYSQYGTSIAGRAVHSLYVQLAGDLGLMGIVLLTMFVYSSMKSVFQILRTYPAYLYDLTLSLKHVQVVYERVAQERLPKDDVRGPSEVILSSEEIKYLDMLLQTINKMIDEVSFLASFSRAILASWIGVLAAATFISVLYYPPIWTLGGLSVMIYVYHVNLLSKVETLIERTKPDNPNLEEQIVSIEDWHEIESETGPA